MTSPQPQSQALANQKVTLESKKAYLFKELTRIHDISGKTTSSIEAEVQIRNCQRFEQFFIKLVEDVLAFNVEATKELKVSEKDFPTFQSLIDSILSKCLKVTSDNSGSNKSSNSDPEAQLPRLKLPCWDGDISKWSEFKHQFDALVHVKNINNVIKLQYLRSCLSKEPLTIVSKYPLDNISYDLAYKDLEQRYQNNRRLAAYYLNKILNYKTNNSKDVIQFIETHKSSTSALKQLKITDLSDFIMFELCYQNLPTSIQKSFDRDYKDPSVPSLNVLFDHVDAFARSEELRLDFEELSVKKKPTKKSFVGNKVSATCPLCSGDHKIFYCDQFTSLSVEDRKNKTKEMNLCSSCLYQHNGQCKSKFTCKKCNNKNHNTLLHEDQATKQVNQCISLNTQSESKPVILGTLSCLVKDNTGSWIPVRTLADPGSEITCMTSSLAQRLNLPRSKSQFDVVGITNNKSKSLGVVNLTVASHRKDVSYNTQAIVLPKICNELPSVQVPLQVQERFKHLDLADPDYAVKKSVDLLLGCEAYADLLSTVPPSIIPGEPSAVKTKFGYIILGRVQSKSKEQNNSYKSLHASRVLLDDAIKRFWEVEEVPTSVQTDPEEDACEEIFRTTHYQLSSGRFGVKLPFYPDAPSMGSNKSVALKCYERLIRRLNNNPSLSEAYSVVMSEYISLGHMSVSQEPISYFLPHHAVVNENRSSTKVRVVFNCSALDDKGLSLNDRLYKGPNYLEDIASLLMKFRFFKVAITGDLRMMYRFVEVHPEHRKFLSIIWKDNEDPEKYQVYQMNRLTFGLKPAGYLAGRCVLELAKKYSEEYPHAANAIIENRYCDDFLSGASSAEECQHLQKELTQLLARGEFEIRKWSSNEPSVLYDVPEDHKEKTMELPTGGLGIKVLGVNWDQSSDCFFATVGKFDPTVVTKRTVLSFIAKLYDITGFYAPTVFKAKEFIQRLWLKELKWDDVLPDDLAKEWLSYSTDLSNLIQIKIPRHVPIMDPLVSEVRLVGFSDASNIGMAAVVYIQIKQGESYKSYLIRAKTKVAPLKVLTIPRLELCGALLLAKLIKSILQNSEMQFKSITLFTDSTIVLGWLKQPVHLMKTYISNRVSQIHELVPDCQWRHVSSFNNAADVGSRGKTATELISCDLWWSGPPFLQLSPEEWPNKNQLLEELPEMKVMITVKTSDEINPIEKLIAKFSSFEKLQRVTAYVLRFSYNLKHPYQRRLGPLSVNELKQSLITCLKFAQFQDLKDDIKKIKDGKSNSLPKQLRYLSLFLDENTGLVRVGGRLTQAEFLSYEEKHPVLLFKSNHLSTLICDFYHKLLLHSGPRSTCAAIRRKYWITSLMVLVKSRIHRCITCIRFHGKPIQPIMSNVPPARLQQTSCWINTAMDFGGPFQVKESNKRKSTVHKAYICVFVCLVTRATLLEMVTDLSAEAFLAALQRFISRRSVPNMIYSDRGTNFTKARHVIKECQDFLIGNESNIISSAASLGIKWTLNTPQYPNANGCAENGVKGSKSLLKKMVGEQVLTFEEFSTLLCRVEAVLNSRPITFPSADPNEQHLCFLTPGHFIVGRELLSVPEKLEEESENLVSRWRRVHQCAQSFWRRYHKSYLNDLVQRRKWTKITKNVKINDLVYVTEENTSPLNWPIGRIVQVHPNKQDGVVRVAIVRIKGKEYLRPVRKMILIPVDPEPLARVNGE